MDIIQMPAAKGQEVWDFFCDRDAPARGGGI